MKMRTLVVIAAAAFAGASPQLTAGAGPVRRPGLAAAPAGHGLQGDHVFGWGLLRPSAVAANGNDLFVANQSGDSVTEVEGSTGALVRVLFGPTHGFDQPEELLVSGGDLFVDGDGISEISASSGRYLRTVIGTDPYPPTAMAAGGGDLYVAYADDTVDEFAVSTGKAVRVFGQPSSGQLEPPDGLVVDGTDLFVLNASQDTLTEFDVVTGDVVRVVSDDLSDPASMALSEGDLYVINENDSVAEIDAATGRPVADFSHDSYGFDGVTSVAIGAGRLIVTNSGNDTVTEIDAATGGAVRILSASAYRFSLPVDVTVGSGTAYVADKYGDSVTELDAATGGLVRVVSGSPYDFNDPLAMVTSGHDVFVANGGTYDGNEYTGRSLTEFDASTGALVRVISGPSYDFMYPDALARSGADIWVANRIGETVTELNATTGRLVRVLSGPSYGFGWSDAEAVDGGDVFIANASGNSITEVKASNGALVRVISGPSFELSEPDALAVDDGLLLVASSDTSSGGDVTEIDAATGRLVRVVNHFITAPTALAVQGDDCFVANEYSVTEIDVRTGTILHHTEGSSNDDLESPDALALVGDDLFVANGPSPSADVLNPLPTDSVTEIDTKTGSVVRVISAQSHELDFPDALATYDGNLFAANGGGQSVSEFPA